jgi:hypothetical protein
MADHNTLPLIPGNCISKCFEDLRESAEDTGILKIRIGPYIWGMAETTNPIRDIPIMLQKIEGHMKLTDEICQKICSAVQYRKVHLFQKRGGS